MTIELPRGYEFVRGKARSLPIEETWLYYTRSIGTWVPTTLAGEHAGDRYRSAIYARPLEFERQEGDLL